jgi:hypothetical protein
MLIALVSTVLMHVPVVLRLSGGVFDCAAGSGRLVIVLGDRKNLVGVADEILAFRYGADRPIVSIEKSKVYRVDLLPLFIVQHHQVLWTGSIRFGTVYSVTIPAFWLLGVALMATGWAWRGRIQRRGRCPECSYDLTGNTSRKCPECGTPAGGAPPSGA